MRHWRLGIVIRTIGVLAAIVLLQVQSYSQLFPFATLKDKTDTAGWDFLGTASIFNDEVSVCEQGEKKSGGIFFNRPINILKCSYWEVSFEFSLRGVQSADGLAFCFLDKPPDPTKLVLGEGIGIPQNATGLKICIDTYNNSNRESDGSINYWKNVPMIQMRWGLGYPVFTPFGSVANDGSQDNKHGDNKNYPQPSKFNDDGSLNYLNVGTNNTAYHQCRITYNNGDVKVYLQDPVVPVLTASIPLAELPAVDGFFGFTSSTGGSIIGPFIRNVVLKSNLPVIEPGKNGAVTTCPGVPVQLGEPAIPGIGYVWSPSTNLNDPNIATPLFSGINSSSATVGEWITLTTTSLIQTTCKAADSVLVNVLPSPSLSFTNAGDCAGEIVTFTPFTGWPAAQESTLSWKWRFNDAGSTPVNADSSLTQIGSHIFNAPGTYNVQLNTQTPAGCKSSVTQAVVIKVGTAAGFSVVNKGKLAYCVPVKLVQKVAGGKTGVTNIYPDYPNATKVSINGIPMLNDTVSIDYKALGITNGKPKYIIKWENIETGGCISVKYDTITLDANPAIRFTALAPTCVNTNTFLITSAKDTMGVAGKGWYQGNGIDSAGNFNPAVAGVGTHSIKYTFQSNYGCVGSASQNIVVNPIIPIDFIVNSRNALCHKIPVNLTQNANGGVPGKSTIYLDYPSSSAKVEFLTTVPSKGTNIALDYTAAGIPPGKASYIVRWENLTPQGCTNFKQDTIVVNPSPTVNFSALAAACLNASPFVFTAAKEVTGVTGKGWYQGTGVDSIGNFNPAVAGIGTHSMKYTFRTNAGCRDSAAQNMVVNAIIPVDFSVLNRNALCYNPTVDLVQNANGGVSGSTTIYLDYGAASTNVTISPAIPVKGSVIKLDYRSAGISQGKPNHIIRWENTTPQGCSTFKQDTIIVNLNPKTSFAALSPVCTDFAPFVITNGAETSGLAGNWKYEGKGITNPNGSFNPALAGSGSHKISYIYTSTKGCADTSTALQNVFNYVTADAGPTRYSINGGFTRLLASSNQANVAVQWTPVLGLSNPNAMQPLAKPGKDQLYQITVTSKDGCKASDTVSVLVIDKLFIPNAFSPNGDGINDVWLIRYLDSSPDAVIQIFDRYGRQIFYQVGYNKPWDGTYRGMPLPVGVYYYVLDLKNGGTISTGSVTLIR